MAGDLNVIGQDPPVGVVSSSRVRSGAEPVDGGQRPIRVCVVVPAFNEAGSVGTVVLSVRASLPEAKVLVVDDGSTDQTADEARRSGASVLSLPVNLGIGGAVQAGYRYALRQGFEIAVQIDGDGQHDPVEVCRLMQPLLHGEADLCIGSRWLGRGSYRAPSARRLGMVILSRLVSWRSGQVFTDTTSGFRAVNQMGLALFAESYPTDFPEVESIVLAKRHGLRIAEVPVVMRDRERGCSSIHGIRSAYYMIRVGLLLLIGQPAGERFQ